MSYRLLSCSSLLLIKHTAYKECSLRYICREVKLLTKERLPFEISTDVSKDVLLYTYENSTFYKLLGIFGLSQLLFWTYLAQFSYKTLRDVPPTEKTNGESLPFWRRINLGENRYRFGITALCTCVGYLIAMVSSFVPLRTVRSLILCRGGTKAKIITYTPIGNTRTIEASLTHLSCQHSRHAATSNISLKIKGRWLYFLLDKRGVFLHPKLFDNTVGAYRHLR